MFNKDITNDIGLAVFENAKIIVTYRDQNNSEYGTLKVIEYTGTTPSISSALVYQEEQSRGNSVSALNSYDFIVGAVDNNNGAYGTVYYGIAASSPDISTSDVTNISTNKAQLNGRVSDNGAQTNVIFQYGNATTGILNLPVDQSPLPKGSGITTVNQPLFGLDENTQYQARIVAWNSSGTTNGSIVRFTTTSSSSISISTIDSDGDGVSDEDEEGGPNDGDANNDGVTDAQQSFVVSLYSEFSDSYITIESLDCEIINDAKIIPTTDSSIYAFLFGAIDFRVTCASSRIRVFYHGIDNLDGFIYRKKDLNEEWFDFDVEFSEIFVNGKKTAIAEFTLNDGGREDYDGELNNVINDPGGPAIIQGAQIPIFPKNTYLFFLIGIILFLGIKFFKM